jgi:hypothetical protein
MPSRLTVVLLSLLLTALAVIFWLWLVILPTRFEIVCPEECRCDKEGDYVDCSHSQLNNIPSKFPKHARHLHLIGNNITYFQNGTFVSRGLVNLGILKADYCNLRKIELGAFNGLTKLIVLSMGGNEISEIIPGTFKEMSRLEVLGLHYNVIEHLESDVFDGLVNLKFILLLGNKLQYLHPDTFLGLSKVQGRQIRKDYFFFNLHMKHTLDMLSCNAHSVSVHSFANISALTLLDLSFNNLRNVDINILKALPELSALYLHGNPLRCDCQLQEVWRWCENHNIQTGTRFIAPACYTPSEVTGIWWGVLEKGQCLQGNIHYYGNYKNTSYSCTPLKDVDTDTKDEIDTKEEEVKKFVSLLEQFELPVSAVLFIFGTTGNIIIIMIITCNKDMRTVPNMYFLNLATSDIIFLTVLFSEDCVKMIQGMTNMGDSLCAFFTFCYQFSLGLTANSVAVLSFQRYRVTVNPLHVRASSQPTWRATGATICGVWIVAALFSVPAARSRYFCSDSILLWRSNYYQRVTIFQLLVSCVLPFCVIAFSYIMTACHLLESSCSLSQEAQNSRLNTRKNTAKVVLGLTLVFLISYVPYHTLETILYSSINLDIPLDKGFEEVFSIFNFGKIMTILHHFLSINPCLNPVALCCTSRAFRRHFKHYLIRCCKAKSTPTDFELEGRH